MMPLDARPGALSAYLQTTKHAVKSLVFPGAKEVVPSAELRHPEHDKDRAFNPSWVIVRCVNSFGLRAHRQRRRRFWKGPAPLNLDVPQYEFLDEDTVIVR